MIKSAKIVGLSACVLGASLLVCAPAFARQPGTGGGAVQATSVAGSGIALSTPDLLVERLGGIESVAIKGKAYSGFKLDGKQAQLLVQGSVASPGEQLLSAPASGGVKRISWVPASDGTLYTIEFNSAPDYTVTNAIAGSKTRPNTPQVLAAFGYGDATAAQSRLSHNGGTTAADPGAEPGTFEMPAFPKAHYSDARVTLRANGADFRQVLWLMSRIGNVSIMLDPYWQEEPTGSRRPPGAGVTAGGGSGDPGAGYRSAGDFDSTSLDEGVGNLSFNFENVPFDTALDLIITSVGLVYTDIWSDE